MAAPHRHQRRLLLRWLAATLFLALVLAPTGIAGEKEKEKEKEKEEADALAEQYDKLAEAAREREEEAPVVASAAPAVSTVGAGGTTVALGMGAPEYAQEDAEDWLDEVGSDQLRGKNVEEEAGGKEAVVEWGGDKGNGRPEKPPGRPLPPPPPQRTSSTAAGGAAGAAGGGEGASEREQEEEEEEAKEEAVRYEKAHPPPGKGKKAWWSEEGEEAAAATGPQPWRAACEGPWGYEGYANKTGRARGGGNGPKGGFDDEEEFAKRCARFNASVQFVESFAAANPDAPFAVGVNNMSDWTPEEVAMLYGAKDPVFDPSTVLDMDDTATVEALITGEAAYEVRGGLLLGRCVCLYVYVCMCL
jgi:hypothetical protein